MGLLASAGDRPGPMDLPDAAIPAADRVSTARVITHLCTSMAVMIMLTSRLALPFGAQQIPLTVPVAVAHLVVIAVLARATISLPRFLATMAAFAVAIFETGLIHRHFSKFSLLYLIAIYAPLVVSTTLEPGALERIWRGFIAVAVLAAVLGITQIAVQTVGGGYYLDPVQLLPENLQLQGYATTYPIMRGVLPTLKANGMLFVEPSAFSQFLALALLGELWFFRRWKVLAVLAGGMVVSFSGTGLMMFAAGLALGGSLRLIIAAGCTGLAAAAVLFVTGYGEAFTARVDEVQRPGTSGYQRFVAPHLAMAVPFEDSVNAVLWGYGAGRVEDIDVEYSANYSPIPKVFLEYGLFGLAAFTAVWIGMFCRLAVPRPITGALWVMYFLAAGSLLQPYTVFTLWALTAGFLKRDRAAITPDWVPAGGPMPRYASFP